MPVIPTRELSVVYGSTTVGGASALILDGQVLLERSFERGAVEFSFLVIGTSESNFASQIASVEAAFRNPFQDLTVVQGAQTILTAKQTNNTALDARPSITKRENVANTGRSRRYTVRIEYGLPADNVSTLGHRSSTVTLSVTPAGRKRVGIAGVFTAYSGSNARAQFEAQVEAFCSAILSALSITQSELVERPAEVHDTNNKTLTFSRVYDELIYSQVGASLNDASVVKQQFVVAKRSIGPENSPGGGLPGETTDQSTVKPLATIDVRWEAWIDKASTQDLAGKWNSVRSWVLQKAAEFLGNGQMALVDERPSYDNDENRISVTLTCVGVDGANLLACRFTLEVRDVFGVQAVPAWTGNPFSRYLYQGPAQRFRTTTVVKRRLGSSGGRAGGGAAGGGGSSGAGGGFGIAIQGLFGEGTWNSPSDPIGIFAGPNPGVGFGGDSVPQRGINLGGGEGSSLRQGPGGPGGSPQWIRRDRSESKTPLRIGFDGRVIDVVDTVERLVEEWVVGVSGSGGAT